MTSPHNADATKIESFIKGLAEEELLYLNRLIVERLKLIAQQKSTRAMSRRLSTVQTETPMPEVCAHSTAAGLAKR